MDPLPQIVADKTGLTVDGVRIAWAEVETIGYMRKPIIGSGALIDVLRRYELVGGDEKVSVKLDGAKVLAEEKEDLWRQLVAVSQERVEPRLREEALARITSGAEPVRIARLELGADGFAWRALRTQRYPWSEFQEAYYASSRIRVLATPKGRRERRVCVLHTDVPNVVLLPKLMADAAQAARA